MSVAPHSRTLSLAGHFSPRFLGSPAKPVGRAAGARFESSSPKRAAYRPTPSGSFAASPPRAHRAPRSREGAQSGCPCADPVGPGWIPRPALYPRTPFPKLAANTAASRDPPPTSSKLCALQRRSDPRKVCAAEPTPYLRWGRARPRRSGAGPAGSSAQPGTHRGDATVAATRAPRRPRAASASLLGGRGLGAPGRGRARGPRLPAVALGHYRPPARLCAADRCARSGGEQATTNGDISRRSTWRAERASVPRRRGRQPSPHRRDVGERALCSHPAAH